MVRHVNERDKATEKHLKITTNNQCIIDVLSILFPELSKQKLKQVMKYGAVWVTFLNRSAKPVRVRRSKKMLSVGDEIHVYYNETTLFSAITPASLVSDEIDYSIWNKPAGMFSQGTKWGDHSAISRWIELFGFKNEGLKERPVFLVHRLDRATNGLIMVAHSKESVNKLSKMFERRELNKYYSALVAGEFPTESYREMDSDIEGRTALTRTLKSEFNPDSNQSSLLLKLDTGRKHQIRRHLSLAGYPVINDRLYSATGMAEIDKDTTFSDKSSNLMLRACRIELECPYEQVFKQFEISEYKA